MSFVGADVGFATGLVANRITITFVPTPLAERMNNSTLAEDAALRLLLNGAETLHGYPRLVCLSRWLTTTDLLNALLWRQSGTVASDEYPQRVAQYWSADRKITEIHVLDDQMRPVPVGEPENST